MRALCGAIITAGALIGLGLAAIGFGTRYTREGRVGSEAPEAWVVYFRQMDTPLVFIIVFLASVAIIGLGIAVLGLAYHHHRREREFAHLREQAAAHQRTTV